MRRAVLSPIAVVLGASLVLAGCASESDAPNETTEPAESSAPTTPAAPSALSSDVPAADLPTATGEFGDKPELEFPSDTHLADGAVTVLSEGDGVVVETGDLLLADYLGQVWGGEVFDNSYDRGAPAAFPIGVGQVVTGWDAGLVGQKVGSRVLLSLPPDFGYGATGNPNAGIEGTDTIVFVVDIVGSFGGDAAGQADAAPGDALPEGGPQVDGALGEPATLTLPEGVEVPTEASLVYLGTGTGPAVEDGDAIIAQFAIASFDEAANASTWDGGQPAQVQAMEGSPLHDLVGVPVGSRVLLAVPAEGEFPAYFVVLDVLAIS